MEEENEVDEVIEEEEVEKEGAKVINFFLYSPLCSTSMPLLEIVCPHVQIFNYYLKLEFILSYIGCYSIIS